MAPVGKCWEVISIRVSTSRYCRRGREWGLARSAGVVVAVIFGLFPFYWTLNASFHPEHELYSRRGVSPWPDFTYLQNYIDIIHQKHFLTYLGNSFLVAGTTTVLALSVAVGAAYALSRLPFRAAPQVLALVLMVSMFPGIAIISPLYLFVRDLHILNTYLALIIPYIALTLPFGIWNLNAFFRELPREIDESAEIDGASPMTVLYRILLPLITPGLFTTAILMFIFAWNEFLFAVTFISKEGMKTVPLGIASLPSEYQVPWGQISAAAVIATLPLVVLVFALQRRIIAGLTAGSVKG